jgi:hypothetical protein
VSPRIGPQAAVAVRWKRLRAETGLPRLTRPHRALRRSGTVSQTARSGEARGRRADYRGRLSENYQNHAFRNHAGLFDSLSFYNVGYFEQIRVLGSFLQVVKDHSSAGRVVNPQWIGEANAVEPIIDRYILFDVSIGIPISFQKRCDQ